MLFQASAIVEAFAPQFLRYQAAALRFVVAGIGREIFGQSWFVVQHFILLDLERLS